MWSSLLGRFRLSSALTRVAILAIFAALLVGLPSFISQSQLDVVNLLLLFTMVGLAVGFMWGTVGQLSIAHGSLWGVGAYTAAILANRYGVTLWLAIPASAASAALLAGALGYLSLRLRGHYLVITTFAAAELFRVVAGNWSSLTGGQSGIVVNQFGASLGAIVIRSLASWYFLLLSAVGLTLLALWFASRGAWGRRLRAIRDNDELARSVGVNVAREKVLAFIFSGTLAGAAGALYAFFSQYVQPTEFGAAAGIQFIEMCILGGSRSAFGPVVGGVVVYVLPGLLALPPTLRQMLLGALLILFVMLAPGGIVGTLQAGWRRVWRRQSPPPPLPPGEVPALGLAE
jgi:branched-chain amino acid transport system permease protein